MVTLKNDVIAPGLALSMEAGAVIDQYDVVKLGAAEGLVIKTSAANDKARGFVHMSKATAAGQGINVFITGSVWARAAGAISDDDWLEATVDGEVTTETPAAGVTQEICGKALGAAAGANERLPVHILLFAYNDETP